ncbi:MAG: 50S ribosomal protein L3 [Desulfobacca sp. 4484_104]|nr:MAG: 50S ribosomal protein L3 [Desulfobacca sp. 4484_104]RLA86595.1 MAG: 50S ribosomal protein L3 [Deltaproteobacteria bacterium]
MLNGILGKKLGMTRLFDPAGTALPVTVIEAGPCFVVQKKTSKREGYEALQLGFERRRLEKQTKPLQGHFSKQGLKSGFRFLREFRLESTEDFEVGQELDVSQFAIGDKVNITGVSKGKGFAGVIKRWGFKRGPETHGSMSHRAPGSIGASAYPSRVFKGKKLPGHLGNSRVTVKSLEVIDVRPDSNLLIVKGAVPGARNGLLLIKKV